MQEVSRLSAPTEGEFRLHAMVRAVLSPGIWFVLAVQLLVVYVLRWQAPADAAPLPAVLAIFLGATVLLLFFYLQAGAFHALTAGREALPVADVIRAGRAVFIPFVWLIIKAGLLFALAMNLLVFLALLLSGAELKGLTQALAAYFGPMTGVVAFVFAYWLPLVFLRREFRLFPSLRAALRIARERIGHSAFLALVVLAPALATGLLPAEGPALLDAAASLVTGLLGWIAYIYCVDVLRQHRAPVTDTTPA